MKILFYSFTGNIKRFCEKLKKEGLNCLDLKEQNDIEDDFILIIPTIGFGECHEDVFCFLKKNNKYLKGVIGSGNRVWANNFCKAADTISEIYNVPVLYKFELSGDSHDVDMVIKEVNNIVKMG